MAKMAICRTQRLVFACVISAILLLVYNSAFQPPGSVIDTSTADWTLTPIPMQPPTQPIPTDLWYELGYRTKSHRPDSPSKDSQDSQDSHKDSHFISWLSGRVPVGRVPFITIGDCNYVHAHRNFRDRLDQWGYGEDFIVICLDQCCADARGFHAYRHFIGDSVAFIKFSIGMDLISNGYNFVFLDGDVYLTGTADPFEHMLPLSDKTWDIQFQPDHVNATDYNIGWYFARSTERTRQFFHRSYARWNETHEWDQAIMNDIGQTMESDEHSLNVHHLNLSHYTNFMNLGWEGTFGQPQATQNLVSESTTLHFACVEQSLKTYFGYYFGGFGDMDDYYTKPPSLLGTVNIAGMLDAVHAQVAFAAQLAREMRRTFIWPDTINLMQKRYDEEKGETILEHCARQPGIRTISWESAHEGGLVSVEGNYLTNFKRVNNAELETVYLNAYTPIPILKETISKLSWMQVAILDFTDFSPQIYEVKLEQRNEDDNNAGEGAGGEKREGAEGEDEEQMRMKQIELDAVMKAVKWLEEKEEEWFNIFEEGGYKNFSQTFLTRLQACPKANWRSGCLEICGESKSRVSFPFQGGN